MKLKPRNPIAKELRSPKYRKRVEKLKVKTIPRKSKHKSKGSKPDDN